MFENWTVYGHGRIVESVKWTEESCGWRLRNLVEERGICCKTSTMFFAWSSSIKQGDVATIRYLLPGNTLF